MKKLWLVPILIVLAALFGFFVGSAPADRDESPLVYVDNPVEESPISAAEAALLGRFWDDMISEHPEMILKVYLNDMAGHVLVFMADGPVVFLYYSGMGEDGPYYAPVTDMTVEEAEELYRDFQEESQPYRLERDAKEKAESKKQGI